jgi:hypothetical protein
MGEEALSILRNRSLQAFLAVTRHHAQGKPKGFRRLISLGCK